MDITFVISQWTPLEKIPFNKISGKIVKDIKKKPCNAVLPC